MMSWLAFEMIGSAQDDLKAYTDRLESVRLRFSPIVAFGARPARGVTLIWQTECDIHVGLDHHQDILLHGSYRFKRSSQHTKSLLHQIYKMYLAPPPDVHCSAILAASSFSSYISSFYSTRQGLRMPFAPPFLFFISAPCGLYETS